MLQGWVSNSLTAVMFCSVLLRPGLDGITLFPLMTVKTVTDTEGTADPHSAPQLTPSLMRARTHCRETGQGFFRCYGILGFLMECLCVLLHNTADVLALSFSYYWPFKTIEVTVIIHNIGG